MAKEYTLRDAGEDVMGMPDASGKMTTEKEYQELEFNVEQLPELATWKVGEEYLLIVKVKQVEHSVEEDDEGIEEDAEFEVLSVGAYNPEVDKYGDTVREKLKLK